MFPRVFQARRLTCRVIFCVVCILPTTAIAVFGAWRTAPFHHMALRDALADALAVGVSLDVVTYPRPGVSRIGGLELTDPETGNPLLNVSTVEIHDTSRGTYLTADTATLHTTRARRLYEELHRRLADGNSDQGWKVRVDDLTLKADDARQKNVSLSATSSMGTSGPVVDVAFRVAGEETGGENAIKLIRNRESTPAETTIFLKTGSTPLPCSLLGQFAAGWNQLGDDATFVGSFWTIDASDGRRGELLGVLEQVDLQQLVADSFGHNLTGKARVRLSEKAVMQRGRLQLATAHIDAGPGSVGQHLLEATSRELQMPRFEVGSHRTDGVVPYRRLVADVTINQQGMLVRGLQPTMAPNQNQQQGQRTGVILAGPQGTILVEPQNPLPMSAVLRALAIGNPDEAILSEPIANLAKWLPEPTRANRQGHAPSRTAEAATRQ